MSNVATDYHRLPSDAGQFPMASLLCAGALLLGVALAWAQAPHGLGLARLSPSPSGTSELGSGSSGAAGAAAEGRLREGSEIVEQSGRFTIDGSRLRFVGEGGKQQLVALENLNLERISQAVSSSPEPLEWLVTGTVTEYRGTNYLLVRRATLRSRAAFSADPPASRTGTAKQ